MPETTIVGWPHQNVWLLQLPEQRVGPSSPLVVVTFPRPCSCTNITQQPSPAIIILLDFAVRRHCHSLGAQVIQRFTKLRYSLRQPTVTCRSAPVKMNHPQAGRDHPSVLKIRTNTGVAAPRPTPPMPKGVVKGNTRNIWTKVGKIPALRFTRQHQCVHVVRCSYL